MMDDKNAINDTSENKDQVEIELLHKESSAAIEESKKDRLNAMKRGEDYYNDILDGEDKKDLDTISRNLSVVNSKRKGRKYTLNIRPTIDQKYLRVLIPFDLEQKKFYLHPEELEIYDVKEYIEQTINKFNEMPEFRIHEDYEVRGCSYIMSWIVFLLIHGIFGYVTLCLVVMTFFNIVIFVFFFKVHMIMNNFVTQKFRNFYNKTQLRKIKQILDEENDTQYCKYRKYTWILGEVSYWLEMRKSLH